MTSNWEQILVPVSSLVEIFTGGAGESALNSHFFRICSYFLIAIISLCVRSITSLYQISFMKSVIEARGRQVMIDFFI